MPAVLAFLRAAAFCGSWCIAYLYVIPARGDGR